MTPPRPVASPRTFIPLRQPRVIWLTAPDGSRVRVDAPQVITDTLFGLRENGEEVWIALADLPVVEARALDRTRTYALLGGIVGSMVLVAVMASGSAEPIYSFEEARPWTGIPLLRF